MEQNVVPNALNGGGNVVVVLASEFEMPREYKLHPRVIPLTADNLPTDRDLLSDKFPSTTRIVLIGGEIPKMKFGALRTVLAKRRVNFVVRKNPTALEQALDQCFPRQREADGHTVHTVPVVEEPLRNLGVVGGVVVETAPAETEAKAIVLRGSLTDFVKENADLGAGSAEEARRLLPIAIAAGIATTVGSLAQSIGNLKRKGGRTERPKSLQTAQQKATTTLDETIAMMQNAIAGLQLVREYVVETDDLNLHLTQKVASLRDFWKKHLDETA